MKNLIAPLILNILFSQISYGDSYFCSPYAEDNSGTTIQSITLKSAGAPINDYISLEIKRTGVKKIEVSKVKDFDYSVKFKSKTNYMDISSSKYELHIELDKNGERVGRAFLTQLSGVEEGKETDLRCINEGE